ncbi:hypothetical protein PIB30_106860 [Stylosanthes scabra]|uniref:Uncharacterized protein n=1 Tax=Stylosanthes scabra TaxID=79078 RepID=A0ABU6UYT3_9FABA|nr:hypothetical protein [Stylosanthes scabra]
MLVLQPITAITWQLKFGEWNNFDAGLIGSPPPPPPPPPVDDDMPLICFFPFSSAQRDECPTN